MDGLCVRLLLCDSAQEISNLPHHTLISMVKLGHRWSDICVMEHCRTDIEAQYNIDRTQLQFWCTSACGYLHSTFRTVDVNVKSQVSSSLSGDWSTVCHTAPYHPLHSRLPINVSCIHLRWGETKERVKKGNKHLSRKGLTDLEL